MKKLLLLIISSCLVIAFTQCKDANQPIIAESASPQPKPNATGTNHGLDSVANTNLSYEPRYDRGYSGNDYSFRRDLLRGIPHDSGGIPY